VEILTRPVGPDGLADLASLFGGSRNTRRCWCTAFCTSRRQFSAGWLTGGNRGRFESLAARSAEPMGILASVAGAPVGWCACGPRSRYRVSVKGRGALLRDLDPDEDERVWFLPCLFVRPDRRGQGVTYALVRAAVELARSAGATAIEGWPVSGSDASSADAFVGRETVFEAIGFRRTAVPGPRRAIMRLALGGADPESP
jgi:GNAT superfamily N-acetyltransferase